MSDHAGAIKTAKRVMTLRENATPPPWHNDGYRIYAPTKSANKRDARIIFEYKHTDDFNDADAPFIADARASCPQLAEAVLEMAAQIAELQKLCDAVLRYDDSGGRQPWRELADMARSLLSAAEPAGVG